MKIKYLAFLPALALFTTPVLAQDTPTVTGQTIRQEIRQERQDNQTSREQTRCQIIGLRLDQTVKNYETRKDIHVLEYTRLYDRLVAVSANLATKGANVTQLNTDLATLNSMISKLSTDYQAFITNLSTNKDQACTLTLEQLKANLANVRTQLQSFRTQSKAIHDFIQNVVRKDLLALRQEVKPTPKPTLTPEPTSAE